MTKHGLKLHPGKTFVTRKISPRMITGVQLSRGHQFAPPAQQRKIKSLNEELNNATDISSARHTARKLMGHYDHVAQIEERFKSIAQGNRARLLKLLSE
ncbi:MAG: hypothetical protein WKF61_07100 [Luteimonas sp.]